MNLRTLLLVTTYVAVWIACLRIWDKPGVGPNIFGGVALCLFIGIPGAFVGAVLGKPKMGMIVGAVGAAIMALLVIALRLTDVE